MGYISSRSVAVMVRRFGTFRWTLGVMVLAGALGCSDGSDRAGTPVSGAQSSESAPGVGTSVHRDASPTDVSAPYLLLRAPGWFLKGATEGSFPGAPSFGGIWTTSYESRPEPNRSVGAALMIARPERTPDELAARLGESATEVTIMGSPGVVVEEHSPQDGHFIATHVLWDLGTLVAWLTVYEVHQPEALMIARSVVSVSEPEWRAAVDRANASPPD